MIGLEIAPPAPSEGQSDPAVIRALLEAPLPDLLKASEELTIRGFGPVVTYSRKVFIPLTHLCRDVCHYCTFARQPRPGRSSYLSIDDVLSIARAGEAAGCREGLFTLGDRPETRYPSARAELDALGEHSTLSYLKRAAAAVLDQTTLLPHLNPGLMSDAEIRELRPFAASMGIMLETVSDRLSRRGGPHFGSPDKVPARRLATIAAAGAATVAFTTGLLIGIGETRREIVDALIAIADLHDRYGHIQEVIIQNFRAKTGTRMSGAPEPTLEDHLWAIAAARLVLGPQMTIQTPPNLRPDHLERLLCAGVNDFGGVSPVTPDHVNPEAPWPQLQALEERTRDAGRVLLERLAIGPSHARDPERWLAPDIARKVRRSIDGRGLPITEMWRAGAAGTPPHIVRASRLPSDPVATLAGTDGMDEMAIVRMFAAEGEALDEIVGYADRLRRETVGETVTYVLNRNINYTNICLYSCAFCAFSKGGTRASRGAAYRLDLDEVGCRAAEAQARGATEVCMQGGIHPEYDGNTYLDILAAVQRAAPGIHIHAFSPLEVLHGAQTLALPVGRYLERLRAAGLASLPGTAAEILDDEVRAVICPDKLTTREWLDVMRAAHDVGLRSTATIMFGHVDAYRHWARHLLAIRKLQLDTGGFTEFVPLPFVHMEAPLWQRGKARSGPSFREALLMHAIARIVLHPVIANIQASWVKLGREGAAAALGAGANDLGGVLMDESITRSAGGAHGQALSSGVMLDIAGSVGRPARQRTTLYRAADVRSPKTLGMIS